MFEYALSNGAGTLLGHGMTDRYGACDLQLFATLNRYTLIIGPADADCVTGK